MVNVACLTVYVIGILVPNELMLHYIKISDSDVIIICGFTQTALLYYH